MRILIAAPDFHTRLLARSILDPAGHTCYEVDSAERAIAGYAELMPESVLLALDFPWGVDGREALRCIRILDHEAHVVMTGIVERLYIAMEVMEAGARDFVVSPFAKDRLLSAFGGHV